MPHLAISDTRIVGGGSKLEDSGISQRKKVAQFEGDPNAQIWLRPTHINSVRLAFECGLYAPSLA